MISVMTKYVAERDEDRGLRVWVVDVNGIDYPLPLRLDLANHSPDGFECGYNGSGPAQLALAICAHALKDDKAALACYQDFKERVIARMPFHDDWDLDVAEVFGVLGEMGVC